MHNEITTVICIGLANYGGGNGRLPTIIFSAHFGATSTLNSQLYLVPYSLSLSKRMKSSTRGVLSRLIRKH